MNLSDSTQDPDDINIYPICVEVIRHFVTHHHWYLFMDEEAFASRVAQQTQAHLAEGVTKPLREVARDAAFYVYCRVWQMACVSPDQRIQSYAYEQLHGYMWVLIGRILLIRNRLDLVEDHAFREDARQEIMMRVVQGVAAIVEPGYFLAWIKRISWRTLTELLRRIPPEDTDISTPLHEAGEEEHDVFESVAEPIQPDPLETQEFVQGLDTRLNQCLKPGERREVIKSLLLGDLRISEIAKVLGLSPVQVTQRKSYAIKVLRDCMALLLFLEAFVRN